MMDNSDHQENEVAVVNESETVKVTKTSCANSDKRAKWTRLAKTMLINLSFMIGLGICEGAFGPSLLDLAEIYDTNVDTLAFLFLIKSIGSVLGSFASGVIVDKYPNYQCVFLFFFTALIGVIFSTLPYLVDVRVFLATTALLGYSTGSLDTAGNVFCLQIWRGLDCGPYMHSIHFFFALGAFVAPIIVAPFLSSKTSLIRDLQAQGYNQTLIDLEVMKLGPSADSQIGYCFPVLGLLTITVSLGYLYYGVQILAEQKQIKREEEKEKEEKLDVKYSVHQKVMVVLLLTFFFVYVGIEYNLGVYLTTFAVECKLSLTKLQGTNLTAIFWGAFAVMRFIAIFAAIKFNALYIMIFSITLSLLSAFPLAFLAEHSVGLLQILTGVAGFGMASIYATGFVWLEQYIIVTNKLAAAFGIAASLGPDVFPTLIGQFVTDYPMSLMYTNLAGVLVCSGLYFGAVLISKALTNVKEKQNEESPEVDMKLLNKPVVES